MRRRALRRVLTAGLTGLLAFLGLGPLATTASAQSYTVIDSVRLPAESFVGDEVELRYTLRTTASLAAPAHVPEPSWGEISSVTVVERSDGIDVRLLIVPYEPGTLTLPAIDLGGIVLDGLSVAVSSVLTDDSEIRSIYGPQRLPGTMVTIFLIALAVIVPLSIALYLTGPGRALVKRLIARHRARIPYRKLLRTIDRLESDIKRDTARDFYATLVHAIQDFMTSRLGFECRSATSTELMGYLPALAAACGAEPETAAPLADVVSTADDAKFGHSQVRRKVRLRHLKQCRSAVLELENVRRRAHASPNGERRRVGA
jgi:hypothetical protein